MERELVALSARKSMLQLHNTIRSYTVAQNFQNCQSIFKISGHGLLNQKILSNVRISELTEKLLQIIFLEFWFLPKIRMYPRFSFLVSLTAIRRRRRKFWSAGQIPSKLFGYKNNSTSFWKLNSVFELLISGNVEMNFRDFWVDF